jgi:hypothetical protein
LPVSELFSGHEVDQLIKLLKTAARERQTVHTLAINAVVTNGADRAKRMVHTAVPISDESGTSVYRLFVYSEKPE